MSTRQAGHLRLQCLIELGATNAFGAQAKVIWRCGWLSRLICPL